MGLRRIDLTQQIAPLEWVVEDLFPRGLLSFVGAQPGVGKTSLLVYLAAQLSRPEGDFLGRRVSGPAASLFVDFDAPHGDGRGFRYALDPILKAVPDADRSRIHLLEPDPGAQGLDELAFGQIRNAVQESRAQLLVIDSMMAAFPGTDNNRHEQIMPCLLQLIQLARSSGVALVMIDHASKPSSEKGDDETRGVRGSQAKIAQARAIHMLTELSGDEGKFIRWANTKNSYGPKAPSFGVRRVQDAQGLRFERVPLPAPPSASPSLDRACEAIWNSLRASPRLEWPRAELLTIAMKTGVGERTAETALKQVLESQFEIISTVQPGRGAPKTYTYRPTDFLSVEAQPCGKA